MEQIRNPSRRDCQADTLQGGSTDRPKVACQADTFETASTLMPRQIDLARRTREYLRREGLPALIGKIIRYLSGTRGHIRPGSNLSPFSAAVGEPDSGKKARFEEVLNLQSGEYVEVKSEGEILQTLDSEGKLNGLTYIPAMAEFCGKRFKVFKRMETMYQEESGKVRRLKHTVLLDGVHCDGMLMRCDRACFFFWREAWLRRVAGPKLELTQISTDPAPN